MARVKPPRPISSRNASRRASSREIFLSIRKPYLYRVDAAQEPEVIASLITRQFSTFEAERIAHSAGSPQQKLNATLQLFGFDPLPL